MTYPVRPGWLRPAWVTREAETSRKRSAGGSRYSATCRESGCPGKRRVRGWSTGRIGEAADLVGCADRPASQHLYTALLHGRRNRQGGAATVTAAGRCGSAGAAGATLPPRRLRRRVVPVGRLSRHTAPVDRTDRQGCRRRNCHCTSCWPPSHRRSNLRSSARPTTRLPARPPSSQGTLIRGMWPSTCCRRQTSLWRFRPPSSPGRGEASRAGRGMSTPRSRRP